MSQTLYQSEIWHIVESSNSSNGPFSLESLTNGGLVVDQMGIILGWGEFAEMAKKFPKASIKSYSDCIILPGFIDAHLHMPQLDMIGAYGKDLIGWLNDYTFPFEARFNHNPSLASETASFLIDQLLSNGTTCAGIFTTSDPTTTHETFEACEKKGIRAIVGKVSMNRNAPQNLTVENEKDINDHRTLIQSWHKKTDRLMYAITPRFAPTSTPEQLQELGDLWQQFPDTYMQTHLSENKNELQWVKELFPNHQDYLSVYESYGLIGKKAIFGHGIHLSDREQNAIRDHDAAICHCPSSNAFLGSGFFPYQEYQRQGLNLCIGSDIGGGTHLNMCHNLLDAYKIQHLSGSQISPSQLLALATLQGAQALKLDNQIGNFATGKKADFQVIQWDRNDLLARRLSYEQDPEQRIFAFITHGHSGLVTETYIQGKLVHKKSD